MKQYTFDDWLNHEFWNEKDILGRYVCNDSERYLDLVLTDKMTFETLNEIQNAQALAYEYMIKCTLKSYEPNLMRWQKNSPDKNRSIKSLINRHEKYIEENQDLYHEVVLPRLHRGMKVGAKYMISEYYGAYKADRPVLADNYEYAPYQVQKSLFEKGTLDEDGNIMMSFPNILQMKYAQMEVSVLWLNRLRGLVREIEGDKNIQDIEDISIDKRKKSINDYGAKYYALAYFFDCVATDNRKYEKQTQEATESDLYQYSNGKRATSTIRKALDSIKVKENKLFNNNTLVDDYGTDWRTKIIELSKYPEKVEAFLQSKRL